MSIVVNQNFIVYPNPETKNWELPIFITRSVIFFFESSEGIVIAFRIVFHSILDFLRRKISNNAILFIISLDSEK
jgi:hypothetical protein